MSDQYKIETIFPVPVYNSSINRTFSKKEKTFFETTKKESHDNVGNITTNNNYVLNNKDMSVLKKDIMKHVDVYFDKIIKPKHKLKPYITQSWINYTSADQYHHIHSHPNSIVSGVFYVDADPDLDKIKFLKREHTTITVPTNDYNLFNSSSWWFSVRTGQIIMFPSETTHTVDNKQGKNIRTSLAFNVFIKGTLGDKRELTELLL